MHNYEKQTYYDKKPTPKNPLFAQYGSLNLFAGD